MGGAAGYTGKKDKNNMGKHGGLFTSIKGVL
jgi:hypothetical protein